MTTEHNPLESRDYLSKVGARDDHNGNSAVNPDDQFALALVRSGSILF